MSDITDIKAWRQRRQQAAQAAAADITPEATLRVSVVKGLVQVRIEDAHVELEWSFSPGAARSLASTLLCHAVVAEAEVGLPARRFHLQKRRGGYAVWLCHGESRIKLPVPELLRRREEARTWAMVYAALNGWPYLEDEGG